MKTRNIMTEKTSLTINTESRINVRHKSAHRICGMDKLNTALAYLPGRRR